ncbi:MAG TPA: FAD:protein FMN transferase [Solirubrobacteraceae bacterium]|nr:FAD:protein FMN transferase [Solirubrobacteraceae bacterium]
MPSVEHEHGFALFGTRVRLLVGIEPADAVGAKLAALRVQARLQRVHRALTRFSPDSELQELNARAGTRVAASPTMVGAIRAAIRAAHLSGGLVDPTVLPALERAGYAVSRAGVAPADLASAIAAAPRRRAARARPSAEWRAIELDLEAQTVRIPAGTRLDLGGTAKGMAVDLAADILADRSTFAVDAGGDIRVGGTRAAARPVSIDHPLRGGTAHELVLTEGAVATSGLRTRVWATPDGFAHHLIDPARGEPAWTGVIQATALAPTALEAETLAKAALLRGPEDGRAILARHGGVLILDDGQLLLAGALPAATAELACAS